MFGFQQKCLGHYYHEVYADLSFKKTSTIKVVLFALSNQNKIKNNLPFDLLYISQLYYITVTNIVIYLFV